MKHAIRGHVRWDDDAAAVKDASVHAFFVGGGKALAKGKTGANGAYSLSWTRDARGQQEFRRSAVVLEVRDGSARVLATTQAHPLRMTTPEAQVDVLVSASKRPTRSDRPVVRVGPLSLDARALAGVGPEIVLDIARALVDPSHEKRAEKRIAALSPDLVPSRHVRRTLCGTEILEVIEELIRRKKWPREIALEVDDILRMRWSGFAEQTHECPNFIITYQDSGPAAVDPDTSAMDVIDPGTNPPVVLDTLPAGGAPTYIKLICFWLERALATYVNAPFSMRNPAASAKIPVVVNSDQFGSASPTGTFFINNALPPEILCAVAVHELFHMVQYEYAGNGTWRSGMREGGATFAEDASADSMNRYLDEAGVNFNGPQGGYLIRPHTSLEDVGFRYKTSLFFRYVAEQHSPNTGASDEPLIGVETYRALIEACEAGSWSSDDIRSALRALPWYQDFYEFGYLDAGALDQTSSEATLGNFALAAYLKDLGTNLPDRRFDFMEDEENIHIDDVLAPILGSPLQTTLASVTLSGTGTLTGAASVNFNGSVPRFASRYHEVIVDAAVTSVEVQYATSGGLTSGLFQVVLVDEDDDVREIYRTDRPAYSKRFPNLRDGKRLDRILLVATGAASAGNFSIAVNPAVAAPDVMITRWHSVVKTEYHIDPRNWAWTWVSPDVWVDNDQDGTADGIVYFDFDNKLHVRLHNKGNQAASGISIELWYQDAAGGLDPADWLPVQNKAGITQSLTALSLAVGASGDWTVDWSPVASGASNHFCVRAIATVPGDPNTDNKRVLSNFGNVQVKPGGFRDLWLWRRNLRDLKERIELMVIPRVLPPGCEIAARDLARLRYADLAPGEAVLDVLRVQHVKTKGKPTLDRYGKHHDDCACKSAVRSPRMRPDPKGNYPTDPRSLPPGLANKPLITVVHLVQGLPLGGVTFLVDGSETKRPRRARRRAAPKRRRTS